ncbi:MAG TPA: metallophosphoesterase [Casimicrobiaceae bacterium]|nr:metallophosphoesterase [Casimicrobiaceae bacterium]
MTPVLQIVHISDLHVVAPTSPFRPSTRDHRLWVRLLSRYIEGASPLKWNEGTPVHSTEAYRMFRRFLEEGLRADKDWFPKEGRRPPTWLVDTGDATTFGDVAAMAQAEGYDDELAADLDKADGLRLFGNHDAWPAKFPLLATSQDLSEQRRRISARRGWNVGDWMHRPLSAAIPGTDSRIELFALNSVIFDRIANTNALGRISPHALAALRDAIEWRSRPHSAHGDFRILAVHHPVDFPYPRAESSAFGQPYLPKTNVLTDVKKTVDALAAPAPDRRGPLVHLLLSGHTHVGHPAHGKLPREIPTRDKGTLHPYQLQLVTGALLCPPERDPDAPERGIGGAFQAELLRFYAGDEPGQLVLRRYVLAKRPGGAYVPVARGGREYEELAFEFGRGAGD